MKVGLRQICVLDERTGRFMPHSFARSPEFDDELYGGNVICTQCGGSFYAPFVRKLHDEVRVHS